MNKLVSCHIITYNQKDFIRECIDSVLMQQTTFDFEIIIGDDLSTDGTREILIDYASKHPDKVRLNLRNERGEGVPGKQNFVTTLNLCKGKYISLCDGDDYWIDPFKLQKQVDFLEANDEYAICFTGSKIKNELSRNETITDNNCRAIGIKQLINSNSYSTASVMFVSKHLFPLPSWFDKIKFGDWALYLNTLYNSKKKAYSLSDNTAVYRIHKAGFHGNLHASNIKLAGAYKMHIDFYRQMQIYLFKTEYADLIKAGIKFRKKIIFTLLKKEGKYLDAIKTYLY